MNRTLSTVITLAAASACVLAGTAAVANVISIDDSPGLAEDVAPVQVSPSPPAIGPSPSPTPPVSAPSPVAPTAPREVSQHPTPAAPEGHENEGDRQGGPRGPGADDGNHDRDEGRDRDGGPGERDGRR